MADARPIFKRILLVVTGIRGYERVVRETAEIASVFHSEVIALYVLDKNKARQLARFGKDSIEAIEADLEEDGWTYLYFTEQTLLENKTPVFLRFEEGAVVEKIDAVAKEVAADLVIAHQPEEDADRAFRSYLADIVENLTCRVLVIKT